MLKTLSTAGRPARPRNLRARASAPSKLPSALLLGFLAAAIMMIAPALANADSSSTLTVIGTSDVSDSGLIPNVIQPGFTKAYPQFTFKYIGTGTGNAIAMAESGAAGASNLIVHAASLENQFVAGGYSYPTGTFGNALWINDFALAGPNSDPAAVAPKGTNDIAQAFAAVAAAGINAGGTPKAMFISRGGTPGTTVAEHGIWALVSSSGLSPAGLLLCTVSSANGGGETPIKPGIVAAGAPCPNGASPGRRPALVVRRDRAYSRTQCPGGQRLQRLPERSQLVLRVHGQRHL